MKKKKNWQPNKKNKAVGGQVHSEFRYSGKAVANPQ